MQPTHFSIIPFLSVLAEKKIKEYSCMLFFDRLWVKNWNSYDYRNVSKDISDETAEQ